MKQEFQIDRSAWRTIKLGEVLELKRGYDLPTQKRNDGAVPIVSSGGISGTHSDAMAKAPGVVTGRYGTIGQVFYVTTDFWPLNTTLYVRDFKGNDPRFVSYLLRTIDFLSCSDKAAVPGVNRNHLHEILVSVPDINEQKRIAHLLGTLDDKIELNRRMSATLEEMARALFKSWFIDFDPVHAKREGRKPFGMDDATATLFPSEFEDSELGPIPRGWRVTSFGELGSLEYGKALKEEVRRPGGVPVYGSNGIVGTHDIPMTPAGAVIVGRKGNAGTVCWAPKPAFVIDTAFFVLPKPEVPALLLRYILEALSLPRLGADSAVPGINRNVVTAQRVCVAERAVLREFSLQAQRYITFACLLEDETDVLATTRSSLLKVIFA